MIVSPYVSSLFSLSLFFISYDIKTVDLSLWSLLLIAGMWNPNIFLGLRRWLTWFLCFSNTDFYVDGFLLHLGVILYRVFEVCRFHFNISHLQFYKFSSPLCFNLGLWIPPLCSCFFNKHFEVWTTSVR